MRGRNNRRSRHDVRVHPVRARAFHQHAHATRRVREGITVVDAAEEVLTSVAAALLRDGAYQLGQSVFALPKLRGVIQ